MNLERVKQSVRECMAYGWRFSPHDVKTLYDALDAAVNLAAIYHAHILQEGPWVDSKKEVNVLIQQTLDKVDREAS